jgi:protein TonB
MNKVSLFFIAIVLFTGHALAQQDTTGVDSTKRASDSLYYQAPDLMPEFPGGDVEMQKFIMNNLEYPPLAIENNIQGRVLVEFIVDEQGKVTQVKVLKGIGWGCDEAAMKVVKKMPRWKPGIHNGKLVKVRYVMPFRFRLG